MGEAVEKYRECFIRECGEEKQSYFGGIAGATPQSKPQFRYMSLEKMMAAVRDIIPLGDRNKRAPEATFSKYASEAEWADFPDFLKMMKALTDEGLLGKGQK